MIKNTIQETKKEFKKGLNTNKNFFSLEPNQTPACIDIVFNNDGSFGKRLGASSMNTVVLESTAGYGMFDFGALSTGIDSYTQLLLHADGVAGTYNFIDSSVNNYTVVTGGGVVIDNINKFGGGSAYFDGAGDFLRVGTAALGQFSSNNFTIDGWIRFANLPQPGSNQIIAGQYNSATDFWHLSMQESSTSYRWDFVYNNSAAGQVNSLKVATLATGTFYHIAIVRNGTMLETYQDGVAIGTGLTISGVLPTINASVYIGCRGDTTLFFDGFLDEFRISKNIARWTANFTPPAEAYYSTLLQTKKLLCAAGTGIYFSSDIGKTWAIAQTNRTASINEFAFVKDYVINTNYNYDPPQYWAGTAGTYFANISTAAPACKHAFSHQGFCILLNESANKTGFYYVDQNSMFTSAFSNFKLPTDRNDELTAGFAMGNTLYVSSKYKIFRMDYIGGNPDWIYKEVRQWGFVPKTVKKVSLPGGTEGVIGLDWAKNIRIFTGGDDEIISDNIQNNNGITPFYLSNISNLDLEKCWAENDKKAQVYRLFLVYANSSTISYALNFNYRTGSFYPEDNRPYQSGILAEDTASNLFMLGCNYNGRVCVMDSGNTEAGVAINEQYTSPFYYHQSPSNVKKNQQVDLFFSITSSGTLYYEDRSQFSNIWNGIVKTMTLASAISSTQIRHTIDIPVTNNVYQFKVSSSANTAEPWNCNLIDFSASNYGIGKP